MTLADYRAKLSRAVGARDTIAAELVTLRGKLAEAKSRAEALDLAAVLLQNVAKDTQNGLVLHLTDIVQLALDSVFPGEYRFHVEFEIKRNQTECRLAFEKAGTLVDPLDASGGGAVDLAAFALRIAAWTLGKTDDVIVLDEPFRFLSRDLAPKAGAILATLSKRLRLQFVIVSHSDALIDVADRVFEVVGKDGVASVKAHDAESSIHYEEK